MSLNGHQSYVASATYFVPAFFGNDRDLDESNDGPSAQVSQLKGQSDRSESSLPSGSKPQYDLRSVISVARMSRRHDETRVRKLHENNKILYDRFQRDVHPKIHVYSGVCRAEFKSIVFNGSSSNSDLSQFKSRSDFKDFDNTFQRLSQGSDHTSIAVAIIFSGKDGLFTNIKGFRKYFSRFKMLNISLFMYDGNLSWELYDMQQLLTVILTSKPRA
jgi:hypothetical protein